MIVHLGIPHWQYAFTNTGLDQQTLQWFRFLSPERLAIDIENRRSQEAITQKKYNHRSNSAGAVTNRLLSEKIKLEGSKRKKRRMRLKSKNANEAIIEKFSTQSCKSAKYAKTTIKKRDGSEVPSNQIGSTTAILTTTVTKPDPKNTSIENQSIK